MATTSPLWTAFVGTPWTVQPCASRVAGLACIAAERRRGWGAGVSSSRLHRKAPDDGFSSVVGTVFEEVQGLEGGDDDGEANMIHDGWDETPCSEPLEKDATPWYNEPETLIPWDSVEARRVLREKLSGPAFRSSIRVPIRVPTELKYTGILFLTFPPTDEHPEGVPTEFLPYLIQSRKFRIVRVPPLFLVHARVAVDVSDAMKKPLMSVFRLFTAKIPDTRADDNFGEVVYETPSQREEADRVQYSKWTDLGNVRLTESDELDIDPRGLFFEDHFRHLREG